jgi:hypothetical protein
LQWFVQTLLHEQPEAFDLLFVVLVDRAQQRQFVDASRLLLQQTVGVQVNGRTTGEYLRQFAHVSRTIDHRLAQSVGVDHRRFAEQVRQMFLTQLERDEIAQGHELVRRILG